MAMRDEADDGGWSPGSIVVTIGGALCLVLVVASVILSEINRGIQEQVVANQQFLQQTAQLDSVRRELINGMANVAVRTGDEQLRAVLAEHGITVNAPSSSAAGPAGAPRR